MADAGFDLALAIGVADSTWQGDDPVVGEHVAVERIQRRVVDFRAWLGQEDIDIGVIDDAVLRRFRRHDCRCPRLERERRKRLAGRSRQFAPERSEWLGHASIWSTKIYLRDPIGKLDVLAARLPPAIRRVRSRRHRTGCSRS